ncbi:hypothetical protein COLO4_25057 [Corchorus olitorius]|uniref:Uncharacterized protein n=1 Tax=Corchorus olitorius TaxID=93759 RepID=A0A1R3I4W1_9ROSI|nr:hypothetical protein COLO4_25057 [Corchorus olitorius]
MKSWHFILLSCLFTAVLRSVRELKMSLPDHKNRLPEAKGLVDEALQSLEKGSNAVIDSRRHSNSNNMDELVYHIDYHGVTTHPTPTPKHPKP